MMEMTEVQKQVDAIFALEGFELAEGMIQIRKAVNRQQVSLQQVYNELLEYAKEHKTIDGFIESREWVGK